MSMAFMASCIMIQAIQGESEKASENDEFSYFDTNLNKQKQKNRTGIMES